MRPHYLALLGCVILAACDSDKPGVSLTSPTSPTFGKATASVTITAVPPTSGSTAQDVNDGGVVTGQFSSQGSAVAQAYVWRPAQPRGTVGTMTELPSLSGRGVSAAAINNAGSIVGVSQTGTGEMHPFILTSAGTIQDLGSTRTNGYTTDVNDAGHVVGWVTDSITQRGARWSVSGSGTGAVVVDAIEELATIPGGGPTIGLGVNEAGQVAGYAFANGFAGPNHAVLWTKSDIGWIVEDLGVLPGAFGSVAEDVNALGQVVGFSIPSAGGCRTAVVWNTQAGLRVSVHALPALGGCAGEAYDINDAGDVVGRSLDRRGFLHATLWKVSADGTLLSTTDLGTLSGASASYVSKVSARIGGVAQAAGFSRTSSGTDKGTLWTVR
jgi:probable HAF family extracellular repeat protein